MVWFENNRQNVEMIAKKKKKKKKKNTHTQKCDKFI